MGRQLAPLIRRGPITLLIVYIPRSGIVPTARRKIDFLGLDTVTVLTKARNLRVNWHATEVAEQHHHMARGVSTHSAQTEQVLIGDFAAGQVARLVYRPFIKHAESGFGQNARSKPKAQLFP